MVLETRRHVPGASRPWYASRTRNTDWQMSLTRPVDEIQVLWGPFSKFTKQDVVTAMIEVPPHIVERLAQGPLPRRWSCGVCEAFGEPFYDGEPDVNDPQWIVWAFHEVPKLKMHLADDQWYGELANETYRRCITTYQAAGWIGKAEVPDA